MQASTFVPNGTHLCIAITIGMLGRIGLKRKYDKYTTHSKIDSTTFMFNKKIYDMNATNSATQQVVMSRKKIPVPYKNHVMCI